MGTGKGDVAMPHLFAYNQLDRWFLLLCLWCL